jgi:hypothetical protein
MWVVSEIQKCLIAVMFLLVPRSVEAGRDRWVLSKGDYVLSQTASVGNLAVVDVALHCDAH